MALIDTPVKQRGGNGLEILQEGLRVYLVQDGVESRYYLDTEYQMIKRNALSCLLTVQLRKEDEKRRLLFDITGQQSLKELAGEKGLSYAECHSLLSAVTKLLSTAEEYLLDSTCVCFRPEAIYRDGGGIYRWLYLPDEKEDVTQELERLFSWLLAKVDYEEQRAVELAYYVFGRLRREGFLAEVLEDCLAVFAKKEAEKQEAEQEARQEEQAEWEKQAERARKEREKYEKAREEKAWERSGQTKAAKNRETESVRASRVVHQFEDQKALRTAESIFQKRGVRILVHILLLAGFLASATFAVLFFLQSQNGAGEESGRYALGFLLLALAFLFGEISWITQGKRQKNVDNRASDLQGLPHGKRAFSPERKLSHGKERAIAEKAQGGVGMHKDEGVLSMDFGEDWEEEMPSAAWEGTTLLAPSGEGEGTTLLKPRTQEGKAFLKEAAGGRVHPISHCPFTIGTDPDNALRLYDKTVSRRHAVVERNREAYVLRDLSSTNGTWVDGERIAPEQEIRLSDGAKIRFANQEYLLVLCD